MWKICQEGQQRGRVTGMRISSSFWRPNFWVCGCAKCCHGEERMKLTPTWGHLVTSPNPALPCPLSAIGALSPFSSTNFASTDGTNTACGCQRTSTDVPDCFNMFSGAQKCHMNTVHAHSSGSVVCLPSVLELSYFLNKVFPTCLQLTHNHDDRCSISLLHLSRSILNCNLEQQFDETPSRAPSFPSEL